MCNANITFSLIQTGHIVQPPIREAPTCWVVGSQDHSENYLYVKSILSGESACEETFQQNKRRAVLRLKTIRYELL